MVQKTYDCESKSFSYQPKCNKTHAIVSRRPFGTHRNAVNTMRLRTERLPASPEMLKKHIRFRTEDPGYLQKCRKHSMLWWLKAYRCRPVCSKRMQLESLACVPTWNKLSSRRWDAIPLSSNSRQRLAAKTRISTMHCMHWDNRLWEEAVLRLL